MEKKKPWKSHVTIVVWVDCVKLVTEADLEPFSAVKPDTWVFFHKIGDLNGKTICIET